MSVRRGPVAGYDFGQKRQYRRNVWATFRQHFKTQMASRVFALMPSTEGAEIEVALSAGARIENLISIDDNRAIAATISRRYPKLRKSYGCPADEAAARIVDDWGQIDGVNLDLCGPADGPLFETLVAWSTQRVVRDEGLVGVNMLRGRERDLLSGKDEIEVIRIVDGPGWCSRLGHRDLLRLASVRTGLQGNNPKKENTSVISAPLYGVNPCKAGVYRSAAGNQTMLWGIFILHEMPCLCGTCFVSFRAHCAEPGESDRDVFKKYVGALRHEFGRSAIEMAMDVLSSSKDIQHDKRSTLLATRTERVMVQ